MSVGGEHLSLAGLAIRNIKGNGVRSLLVVFCLLVVAGFSLASAVAIRGIQEGLRRGIARLGADVVVIPDGADAEAETALLTGATATALLPVETAARVSAVPGVGTVSPQLYLGPLRNVPSCALPEIHLVAIDPATDFTVRPWLARESRAQLGPGEALAGSAIIPPGGKRGLAVFGYEVALAGRLEQTGTSLDRTLFVSFETARSLAEPLSRADPPLRVPESGFSALLVKAAPGADLRVLAPTILQQVPGVLPVESPGLFRALQRQMDGLMRGTLAVLAIVWGLAVAIVGLVFTLIVAERRREIAILRALGSPGGFVLKALVLEAAALALTGGALGVGIAAAGTCLLADAIGATAGVPFAFPPLAEMVALMGLGLLLALSSGTVAALWPALRASRQDPALAMRE